MIIVYTIIAVSTDVSGETIWPGTIIGIPLARKGTLAGIGQTMTPAYALPRRAKTHAGTRPERSTRSNTTKVVPSA
jgi:hypothetical protein